MRRTKFKHQKYGLGFKVSKEAIPTSYDQLFQARLPYFNELLFGAPEDTQIMDLLGKKFIRSWKKQLIQAREQMGRRKFNQAMAAWLNGDVSVSVRRTKRATRRRNLTE